MAIAVITDSASQIPVTLAERLGVQVVPIIVTIDGIDYREGVDLVADDFWALFGDGAVPEVTTTQPSPGAFLDAYRVAAANADEIVSIHVGADVSGTVNSATQAARLIDTPVHVIDSGTASFGVAACVWRACDVVAAGGGALDAAGSVAALAPTIGTSFILQATDFASRGGRLTQQLPDESDGVMVLSGFGTALDVTGLGRTVDELCDLMTAAFLAEDAPISAAVGVADPATLPFADGLEERLRESDLVVDIVRYQVGPSIGAHTGPGTAGGFWWPAS